MHKPDPSIVNAQLDEMRKVGYDTRDIDLGQIGKNVFGFFIFTLFCIVIGLGPTWYYGHLGYNDPGPSLKPQIAPGDTPLLQTDRTAHGDIVHLREREDRMLTTYGWVDEKKGVVRLPVEVAMEQALAQGFPERGSNVAEPEMTTPGSAPGGGTAPEGTGTETVPGSTESKGGQ